ncbi:hypothetical protein [uncultured Kordia sp.]|uniref:hypothetical protein n=1 Tax=uncultured Kordia sp. TaxID=507699 RepID=UPI00261C4E72|nr:hypothetical protein [uncultured Kordia sp.]
MKLFKSVDKVLARMGSSKATERAYNEPLTVEKTKQIPGEQIAASEAGGIWAGIQELNGYVFMELVILDTTKIKTFKGISLKFLGDNQLTLDSDTKEVNSEFSDLFNRWLTQVSFEISKKELNFIKRKKYTQVQLDFKNKSLMFEVKK